jgi:hypothetical protein
MSTLHSELQCSPEIKKMCVFLFDALEGIWNQSKFAILKYELCPLSFLMSSYATFLFYSKANASERTMVAGRG